MADSEPTTDAGSIDPEVLDPEQDALDVAAADGQARLWLRAITATAETLGKMSESVVVDRRVRYAVDQALIAAAERIGRLCRGDQSARTRGVDQDTD